MAQFDRNFYKILFLVIVLTAAGQMTNTIYVPALTQMAHEFSVSAGRMQAVIACYLFPYGLLQFLYGPLSDQVGRKPMILIGIILFIAGSILATFATYFPTLLIASLLQGSGIAVGGVMARTVMRDLYSGTKLHAANSMMAIALILAPLIAPVLGGIFTDLHSWRLIFIFLSVYGIVLFFIQLFLFKETNIHKGLQQNFFQKYQKVLSNRTFLINLILLMVANGGIAVFEVSSGALFTSVLGLNPASASLLFIIPLPCYVIGSFAAGKLARYYSLDKLLIAGCSILFISGIVMIACYYGIGVSLTAIILPGCIYFFGSGIIFPTATTKALEEFPSIAGTAGAVLGGTQNLGAGILTALAAIIPLHSQLPLAVTLSALAVCALAALMIQTETTVVY
ncbi:MFS transporter [Facilibium subflavum]|uniref:MFS transporter n=1 Tax=Facilibium subflavum TaxID=2219058 RepID=UPI000E65E5BE|nr:MFS transporter [Facilibium subflavum]